MPSLGGGIGVSADDHVMRYGYSTDSLPLGGSAQSSPRHILDDPIEEGGSPGGEEEVSVVVEEREEEHKDDMYVNGVV